MAHDYEETKRTLVLEFHSGYSTRQLNRSFILGSSIPITVKTNSKEQLLHPTQLGVQTHNKYSMFWVLCKDRRDKILLRMNNT